MDRIMKCNECKTLLTDEELEYYTNRCEKCESKAHTEMQQEGLPSKTFAEKTEMVQDFINGICSNIFEKRAILESLYACENIQFRMICEKNVFTEDMRNSAARSKDSQS